MIFNSYWYENTQFIGQIEQFNSIYFGHKRCDKLGYVESQYRVKSICDWLYASKSPWSSHSNSTKITYPRLSTQIIQRYRVQIIYDHLICNINLRIGKSLKHFTFAIWCEIVAEILFFSPKNTTRHRILVFFIGFFFQDRTLTFKAFV